MIVSKKKPDYSNYDVDETQSPSDIPQAADPEHPETSWTPQPIPTNQPSPMPAKKVGGDPNNVMRHEYRDLSADEKANIQGIKDKGREFYLYLNNIGDSKELALAKQKIEEAVMWATKAVS
jgi:hypothetical protein